MQDIFVVRKGISSDRNFITKSIAMSWLQCPKNNHRSIETFKRYFNYILGKSRIYVLCLRDDPDDIISFIIYSPKVKESLCIVHALYTKNRWRGLGFASKFLVSLSKKYTKIGFTLDLKDAGILASKVKKLFNEVQDYSSSWKNDRVTTQERDE